MTSENVTVEADDEGEVALHVSSGERLTVEENLTVRHDEDKNRALILISGFDPEEDVEVQKLST